MLFFPKMSSIENTFFFFWFTILSRIMFIILFYLLVSFNLEQFLNLFLSFIFEKYISFVCVLILHSAKIQLHILAVIPQKQQEFSVHHHHVKRDVMSICCTTGDVNVFVKVVPVSLYHCNITIFPLKVNKYLMQRYFERISSFSSYFPLHILVCIGGTCLFL